MKILANYDLSGRIRSLTWSDAPKGVSIMLTPRPGEIVAEVEGHNLADKRPPTEKELRDLARNHRIETPLARRTLAKKQ